MTKQNDWHAALSLDELEPGTMRTFKKGGCQLALGRTEEGSVFAVDNRCPHEGYPLAQGTLKENALTCCWHNWKFDVRDGSCTLGGEGVRVYPSRVRDGQVEVDLSQPDPETLFPAWKRSLEEGIFRHDNGRAIRDGVRLLQGGYDPYTMLADIVAYDAYHAEYGTTHTLAVAVDAARMLERHPGVEAMYVIGPVIDLCGDSNRRLPSLPVPEPSAYRGEETGELLREAVEAEDVERALALFHGALDADVPRATIERWMYAVISDHFLDFGHQLIYMTKAQELLDRVDGRYVRDFYHGLLFKTLLGTREDTLPYMSGYSQRLRAIEGELPDIHARISSAVPFEREDFVRVRDAVLDGSREAAFDAVLDSLRLGVHPTRIAEALVAAASRRFLRFDVSLDSNPEVAENWLWVTHRFTFASAVRVATTRFDSPDVLRLLFQAVMFVHSGKPMDRVADQGPDPLMVEVTSVEPEALTSEEIIAAIAAKDSKLALQGTAHALRDEHRLAELERRIEALCLADPLVRPIVVAHAIKTSVTAFDEVRALAETPDRETPLLACVRFLASPIVERRVREAVGHSIAWVAEGIMPSKLTQ